MAEMFTNVTRPAVRVGAKRWYTVPLSIVVHAVIVAVLVAVPLLATGTLPMTPSVLVFALPEAPKMPETPRAPTPRAAASSPAVTAPVTPSVPTEAASTLLPDAPSFALGVTTTAGVPGGLPGVEGALMPASPAVPPVSPAPIEPQRPGGQIKEPVKIYDVAPVYPMLAQKTKVSGIVILDAVIDTQGRVPDVKVLRSIPFLDQAALDAVRQWRYRPTLLNGTPIAIRMTVTVSFVIR